MVVLGSGLLGHAIGEIDQNLGLFLGKGYEVTSPGLEDVIDEAFEGRPIGKRQVALEDYAVKTREHSDDQADKLDDEARQRLHGVLLQGGCLDNIIIGDRTPFLPILSGCGSAALGKALRTECTCSLPPLILR